MLATSDKQLVQSVIDEMGSAISMIDVTPDGNFRFLALNPRETELRGNSEDEIAGRTPHDFLPPIEADREVTRYR